MNRFTQTLLAVVLVGLLSLTGCKSLTQNYGSDTLSYRGNTPWLAETSAGEVVVLEEVTDFQATLNQERSFAELEIIIDGTYDWTPEEIKFSQSEGDRGNGFMFKAKGYSTAINVDAVSRLAARDEILGELLKDGAVEGTNVIGNAVINSINPAAAAGDLIPAINLNDTE
jgi:hypothetical protein